MINGNEHVEIILPEEVMEHLQLAAKEIARAELAYVEIFDPDLEEFDDDNFCKDMCTLLIAKMSEILPTVFDEVLEEEGF